jgi:hypothetical protein
MREEVDEGGAQIFRNEREVTDAGFNLLLKMKLGTWKELRNTARPTAVIIQPAPV